MGVANHAVGRYNELLATAGKTYNDVTVAVMDTGINDAHKSFDGRLIECNKNFSSSGSMNSSSDDSGHGTSVAGVIALNTLDNVKIKPYKTFDKRASVPILKLWQRLTIF